MFNAYSTDHSSFSAGTLLPDGFVTDIKGGTLRGVGKLCFYSQQDITVIFEHGWSIESLRHKQSSEMGENQGDIHAEWEVVARKV